MRAFKSLIALVAILAVQAQAGVSGFVDAQYRWHNDPAFANNFVNFDGALWATKELGKGKAVLDVPITITGGAISLAQTKAQGYVNYGYDNGLDWTLGQFDSPLGVEANDSVNYNLSTQGLLYSVTPVVHQGLMLNYANSGFSVKLAAANPNLVTRTGTANLEYFGQVKYAQSGFWGSLGYVMSKNSTTALTASYLGIAAGMKMNELTVDAAAGIFKAAYVGAVSGTGLMLNVNYAVNKMWNVSLRPEMLSKANVTLPATGATGMYGTSLGNDSVIQVAFGPQANMTDDLKVKIDYTFNSTKAISGGTSKTSHMVGVAAVHKL